MIDKMKKELYIVIPAYNEEKSIDVVVNGLKKASYNKIVVVDDGSKDKTYDVAKKAGAVVLQHFMNRGQGAALKTGIDAAVLLGADIVITFDADGQHQAKDILKLVEPVEKGEVDVALGSRFLGGAKNMPFLRRVFLKGGAVIIWIFYGIWLTDSHNGFRALSRKAAQLINIRSDKMEHASEILDEISRKKLKYKEVPVEILYTEYSMQRGQSTWNAFNILFKMVKNKFLR
jgi:polyprenyl-phospho-N-acetylgalactosaminyl synthase